MNTYTMGTHGIYFVCITPRRVDIRFVLSKQFREEDSREASKLSTSGGAQEKHTCLSPTVGKQLKPGYSLQVQVGARITM